MGNVLIQQTSILAQKIIQINGEILKLNKTLYLHDWLILRPIVQLQNFNYEIEKSTPLTTVSEKTLVWKFAWPTFPTQKAV